MSKNKVEIVGVDTSKLVNLEKNEIVELLNKYHSGDKNVFNTFPHVYNFNFSFPFNTDRNI